MDDAATVRDRFLGVRDAAGALTDYRYENRSRAWQRGTVPLSPRYYVSAYNEIWFYVKPYVSASALDQNRNGRVTEANHTLMFTITSRAPFGRR